MSHCKNSVRDTAIGKKWICSDLQRSTLQGVDHCRGKVLLWPWNVVRLGFMSWVNSYANEWENHPKLWGNTHSSVFWQCLATVLPPLGVSFSLQIGDQCLVESDLSSWTHLTLISLCYPLGYVILSKVLPCPLPSCFTLQTHHVASTIFWRDNQKIAGPWEGNSV